jgi:nickel-dependent lactate racemase
VFDAVATDLQPVHLQWDAWHGDYRQRLDVPASWQIVEMRMADAPALSPDAVAEALEHPLGALPLDQISVGHRAAAIAIDDLTRPTHTAPLVEHVVRILLKAGLTLRHITIVIASGAHRLATARDIELKIGALANRLRVVAHDPTGDLTGTGMMLGGVPVRLNRAFLDADLRIGIGCVMPHPFAGFSGGGKIVVPGLADLEVLARTHKFALMGLQGGAKLTGNRFRTEMEDVVRRIGLDWSVNVVVNGRRETAFLAAGDFVAAHRAAAAAAANVGATRVPDQSLDALILNAYPKDGELLQVEAALVALHNGLMSPLGPSAPVILTAACRHGLGVHGLFGPNGRLFRTPAIKTFLGKRPLWFYSPGADVSAARVVAHETYPFFSTWSALVENLQHHLRPDARVGIVPCGPLQIADGIV